MLQTPRRSPNDHEGVHHFEDAETGAAMIIAIHSTRLGPAAGGCRLWTYSTGDAALEDALRLSKGMSFKNAMAGLPMGGGKAVLMKPSGDFDRTHLFSAFGRAVQSLGGSYITAEDVGTSVQDMAVVAQQTRFVAGLPVSHGALGGDPSPWTALGVFLSLKAALRRQWGDADLSKRRVAVQGVGNVGYHLCALLHEAGAKLVVADHAAERAQKAVSEFGAALVPADTIAFTEADVFAPCALGGVLNGSSIPRLGAPVVVGAANNQLATDGDADALSARGILYAPDYIVNAGGIIAVAAEYFGWPLAGVQARLQAVPDRLAEIFDLAVREGRSTSTIADELAQARIDAVTFVEVGTAL